ncbi:unnamed protein product, partial [Ectocarpus sp. 12 AP-2014]
GPDAAPIAGALREAAECITADDSDPTRNPSYDLCLSPASADVFSLAVTILVESKKQDSWVTHPDVMRFQKDKLGVSEAFVREPGEPAYSYSTI